jgi:hypothetical protein
MCCPHCEHDNWEGVVFCHACGRALTLICPERGNLPHCGATLCDGCGTPPIGWMAAPPLCLSAFRSRDLSAIPSPVGRENPHLPQSSRRRIETAQGPLGRSEGALALLA